MKEGFGEALEWANTFGHLLVRIAYKKNVRHASNCQEEVIKKIKLPDAALEARKAKLKGEMSEAAEGALQAPSGPSQAPPNAAETSSQAPSGPSEQDPRGLEALIEKLYDVTCKLKPPHRRISWEVRPSPRHLGK